MAIQVASLYATVGADLAPLSRGLTRARSEIKSAARGIRGSLRGIADVAEDIQPVGFALSGIAAAGGALLASSAMVAARVQELGFVLQTVGHTAGYSSAQIAQFETGVKGMGITTRAARQALVQMAQANIDFAHATDLARLAQDAAVIAQIDSSEAFTRLITVVQRGSPVMARTMGLTVDFQGAYKRLAEELGKTTLELTAQEKMQARLGEVMAQGASIAGTYDSAMGSVGKQMRSLNRHFEEAQVALGEVWLPAMGEAVAVTTDVLKAFNALTPEQKRVTSGFVGVTTAVTGLAGGFILLAPRIVKTVKALKTLQAVGTSTMTAFPVLATAALPVLAALTASVVAVTMAVKLYNDVQEQTVEAQNAWSAQLKKLVDSEMTAERAMYSYRDSQEAVARAYAEGGIIAQLFIDEQKIARATTEELTAMVVASADSYADYRAGMELVNDEIEVYNTVSREAANSAGVYASVVRESVPVLDEFQFALKSGEIALHDSHAAAILYVDSIKEVEGAASATGGSLYDLAASASSVAGAFGEMTFDDEQLWKMALATGASLEALTALAGHLGIATDAEIQNTMAGYALIKAFEGGAISADALASGFSALETSTIAAAGGFSGLDDDMGMLKTTLGLTTGAADGLTGSFSKTAGALDGVEKEALAAAAALNAIPRDIDVNINIHTRGSGARLAGIEGYQSGTSFYPGGLGVFGEAGPELAVLPRGARVYPAAQTQQMLSGGSTWTGNIIISGASDPQATADAVVRRLQDRGLLPRANLR